MEGKEKQNKASEIPSRRVLQASASFGPSGPRILATCSLASRWGTMRLGLQMRDIRHGPYHPIIFNPRPS